MGGERSDFIAGTISNGFFVHRMFLIPLILVTQRYMGHWGAVKADEGQSEVEVSRLDDEAQLREEVGAISKSGWANNRHIIEYSYMIQSTTTGAQETPPGMSPLENISEHLRKSHQRSSNMTFLSPFA